MKILMICEFYNEKLEYQENLLTKYYAKHGHDVTVITSTYESVFDYYENRHDNAWPAREYRTENCTVIKLPFRYNILYKMRAYTRIDDILEREKPDLIFIHDIMLNIPEIIRYKKKHPDCVIILDYHADYSNSGKNWLSLRILHGVLRKWFLDRIRKYTSRIFPIVPAGTTFLHEVYKVPLEEMEVLPLGADTDLGAEAKQSPRLPELRKAYGIAQGDRVILTGGKLSPRKRTELIIDAVNELEDKSLHLIIVGDASEEDQDYKNLLLSRAQQGGNIHFAGWLGTREIYEHMAISDIAVFPASQSILWQQAISMGLPLIAGNTGHQSIQYLNLYENIVILDKDRINTRAIKKELTAILENSERHQEMREGAERVTREQLDWNTLIDRTLTLPPKRG
ncbi:glycosyltransferase family 4 protein [Kordiimonas sp.]|uniref:glycosyltransferase family 4 protein n=1 Tax=Kordiimonas sp. TaxID=1970157 RepID=UPI003A917265